MADLFSSRHVAFRLLDGGGHSETLTELSGDPDLGEDTQDEYTYADVGANGAHVGRFKDAEQAKTVSFSVLVSATSTRARDLVTRSGATYGGSGTTPAVTVDPLGEAMAVQLEILVTPPGGSPSKTTYGKAYGKAAQKTAPSGATFDFTFECFQRSEA